MRIWPAHLRGCWKLMEGICCPKAQTVVLLFFALSMTKITRLQVIRSGLLPWECCLLELLYCAFPTSAEALTVPCDALYRASKKCATMPKSESSSVELHNSEMMWMENLAGSNRSWISSWEWRWDWLICFERLVDDLINNMSVPLRSSWNFAMVIALVACSKVWLFKYSTTWERWSRVLLLPSIEVLLWNGRAMRSHSSGPDFEGNFFSSLPIQCCLRRCAHVDLYLEALRNLPLCRLDNLT